MRGVTVKRLRVMAYNKWIRLDDKLKAINPFRSYFRKVKLSYMRGELI